MVLCWWQHLWKGNRTLWHTEMCRSNMDVHFYSLWWHSGHPWILTRLLFLCKNKDQRDGHHPKCKFTVNVEPFQIVHLEYYHVFFSFLAQHQPSADKNIYGSSQHNSLELTRLNGTTGSTTTTMTITTTAPSLTGLPGNGLISANGTPCHTLDRNPPAIRIPQYTLQDVEFVEELGEGAFGKKELFFSFS